MHLDIYESLTSTQDIALLHLHEGDRGPSWVMARRQTHGLGRMGRIWSDGLGNLMATRYHVMSIELEKISQLSFVTALAVYDALSDIEGVANDLTIKWPNDLLHSGRKLCGILINSESQGEGEVGIAIGIGVNIASAPELATYDTACLASILSYVPKPEDLLRSIDAALEKRLNLLENKGFDPIASDWLSHAYGRDHPITVQTPNGPICGFVVGINHTGMLKVKDSYDRVHLISNLE